MTKTHKTYGPKPQDICPKPTRPSARTRKTTDQHDRFGIKKQKVFEKGFILHCKRLIFNDSFAITEDTEEAEDTENKENKESKESKES